MTVRHVIIGAQPLRGRSRSSAILIWAVLSPKRADEETKPANLTPFLRRRGAREPPARTRAGLGAAVRGRGRGRAAALLVARAEPAERVRQLLRQERGRARAGPVLELVDAHLRPPRSRCSARTATAPKGQGGTVPYQCSTARPVVWQAPPLNTVLLRFQEDPECSEPAERAARRHRAATSRRSSPTAGPARRCRRGASAGGGPKNTQSIQDLVAYLRTIQLKPGGSRRSRRRT